MGGVWGRLSLFRAGHVYCVSQAGYKDLCGGRGWVQGGSVSKAGHECCVGVTGRLQKTWGEVCGCVCVGQSISVGVACRMWKTWGVMGGGWVLEEGVKRA